MLHLVHQANSIYDAAWPDCTALLLAGAVPSAPIALMVDAIDGIPISAIDADGAAARMVQSVHLVLSLWWSV